MNSFVKRIIFKLYISLALSFIIIFPSLEPGKLSGVAVKWLIYLCVGYPATSVIMKSAEPVAGLLAKWLARPEAFLGRVFAGRRMFFACWLVIVLAWIRPYLALFPGTFGYDAPVQLAQWLGTIPMTDQHPVAHTFVLGVIYDCGSKLFGSQNGGIALFTALQGLLISGSIAYCFYYMRKRGSAFWFLIPALLWICFNPYLQVLSFNCTKDIMFGAFMLLFIVFLHSFLHEEIHTAGSFFFLWLYALLTCLFRNQGIYILLVLLIFMLLALAKRTGIAKFKASVPIALAIVLAWGFGFFCHNVLHYEAVNDSSALFGLPIQQVASVGKARLDGLAVNVTDEELAAIERIIPEEGLQAFEITCVDPVKEHFDAAAFKENFADSALLYFRLGLKNAGSYFTVFRVMTEGYYDTAKFYHENLMFYYSFKEAFDYDIVHQPIDKPYYDSLQIIVMAPRGLSGKLAAIFYNSGICLSLLAILVGLSIYRKDYRLWLTTLPMLLFLGTLFLGPAALVRYLYPLILLVPFMCFLLSRPKSQ